MKRSPIHGLNHGVETLVHIADVVLNQLKETDILVLAIAGGSCSGKSLLAQKSATALNLVGIGVAVLNFDDYYKDRSYPDFPLNDEGQAIFDLPESYLLDEFRYDMKTLLAGKPIVSPIFDKKTNTQLVGQGREVLPESVIITEGLFVIQTLIDFPDTMTIFVEADKEIRISRRVKRDTGQLHDNDEETRRFVAERVEPYYEKYVAPQKDLASLIIVNNNLG